MAGRGRSAGGGGGLCRGQGRQLKSRPASVECQDPPDCNPAQHTVGGNGAMRIPASKAGLQPSLKGLPCEGNDGGHAASVFGALLTALGAAEGRQGSGGTLTGGPGSMAPPACRHAGYLGTGSAPNVVLASDGNGPIGAQHCRLFGAALAARWHFAAHARILAARPELFGEVGKAQPRPMPLMTRFAAEPGHSPVPLFI